MFALLRKLKAWRDVWEKAKALLASLRLAWGSKPSTPSEPKDEKGWTKTGKQAFDSRLDPKD